MAQKKKLQVFVSSTYTDLREERQAAVEAILTAGHIPAGMELFAAGDETQMNVIKRWIDESDVYMLILGGRYGSIEPVSQKSYIHLEYEYALEKGKPVFAVVTNKDHLEEKVKKEGTRVIELDHPDKLKDFREFVCSKMVRFWGDSKDIKLSIMETMADFSNREELVGWIPGNEAINAGAVAEEIARLAKENAELRVRVNSFSSQPSKYNGLTYDEMYEFLNSRKIDFKQIQSSNFGNEGEKIIDRIKDVGTLLGDKQPSYLHYYWVLSQWLDNNKILVRRGHPIDRRLHEYGLLEIDRTIDASFPRYKLTESGKQFLLKLRQDSKHSDINLEGYIFNI